MTFILSLVSFTAPDKAFDVVSCVEALEVMSNQEDVLAELEQIPFGLTVLDLSGLTKHLGNQPELAET